MVVLAGFGNTQGRSGIGNGRWSQLRGLIREKKLGARKYGRKTEVVAREGVVLRVFSVIY